MNIDNLDEALGDGVIKALKNKLKTIVDAVMWLNKMAPKINKLNKVIDNTKDIKKIQMAQRLIDDAVKNLEAAVDDAFGVG